MECIYCKGHMKKSKAPFSVDRKGYHVHWDALPAWVCPQCGEPYFEATVVDSIERALTTIDRDTQHSAAVAHP